jgi:ATP-dependent Lhr-like helicase
MGDLSSVEIAERVTVDPAGWIASLAGDARILELPIPTAHGPQRRWVAAEYALEYMAAFDIPQTEGATATYFIQENSQPLVPDEAQRRILERFLRHAGPVTVTAIQGRYAFPVDWLTAELDHLVEARQLAHGHFTPDKAPMEEASAPPDEFVDLRTLEQIHRRTLTILRQEVRPVPFSVYADFLARWGHLHPDERLAGDGALRQALQGLRAAPVAGQVWERDVLPLRLAGYDPAELEALCQSGELVWIGSGGVDPRRGRVRFLFRGEGSAYLEPAPEDLSALSDDARGVYDFLKAEGAVFFADLRAGLELDDEKTEGALVELVMAGLVTNDSLGAMRQIVERGAANLGAGRGGRGSFSSLEEQLADRLGDRRGRRLGDGRRPSPSEYRAAKRRARQRLEGQRVSRWAGRWTLVHRFGVMGKALPPGEPAAHQARQLLVRHGVVTRASLEREEGAWEWGLIYPQLQRMEMRGEVRRGYFVKGLPGLQFALPEAVEQLRALGKDGEASEENGALVVMNACDPANLYGLASDALGSPESGDIPRTGAGEPLTFARIPSTWLVQGRGLPVLVAEDTGARLTTVQGASEGLVRRALRALLDHLASFEHRVTVQTWNGAPVLGGAGQQLLESVGFYRDYPGMTWERR